MDRLNECLGTAIICLMAALVGHEVCAQGVSPSKPVATLSVAAGAEWRHLGGNSQQWQHSSLTQINDQTVGRLSLAWVAEIPSGDGLVGNPLIADGVVYQSGPPGRIYANDVRTGKELWVFNPELDISPKQSMTGFWTLHVNRGLALDGDKLFVASNCRILAVDRNSGHQVWAAQSCDPTQDYGITGAPRVGGGKVFIGNSGGEELARGFVDAFDEKTGQHLWRFYTMPGDPTRPFESPQMAMAAKTWGTDYWKYLHGGANAWDALTYDGSTDTLYFGTDGLWSPTTRAPDAGEELFANCIVAVNASTGQYLWHYKTVPHDAWNLDATMHIMVTDLPQAAGPPRHVVMTAPKNGFFYVLDAKTGQFISAKNYENVNWTSHIDPVSGRPVPTKDSNYWEHPGSEMLTLPGDNGSHNWELMAFHPSLRLIYIPASITPEVMKTTSDPQYGLISDEYYGYRGDAVVTARGELVAWDPVTQTKRWSAARQLPTNGGVLATDGNLVFQGTGDGKFEAFNAKTGQKLWAFDAHATILAAPATVEVDGIQLILVPSGNGGSSGMRSLPRLMNTERSLAPSRLLAFRLDGKASLPPLPDEPFPLPARPKQPAALAKQGAQVFEDSNCGLCHGKFAAGSGPGIPDLRKLSIEKYGILKQIVIGGALRTAGMPSFPNLSDAELDALGAYLTNQAWERFEQY
jgi:PQQ-dependent dehydrogenase (methanol/ethanol family)